MKKMKFFMTALITLSCCVINAKAEEFGEIYQKLTTDGTLTVTDTSLAEDKTNLIWQTVNKVKLDSNYFFSVTYCNDDHSKCDVALHDTSSGTTTTVERHTLNVKYEESYSEQFKEFAKDGKTIIPFSTVNSNKRDMINTYVGNLQDDKKYISVSDCNDDYSICTFILNLNDSNIKESHNVNISFEESYSDEFKKILKDGYLSLKAIAPTTDMEREFILTVALDEYNTEKSRYYIGECNETFTVCNIDRYDVEKQQEELHKVNMKYMPTNKTVKTKVNEFIKTLPEEKLFITEDLELINYIVNGKYRTEEEDSAFSINYSNDWKKLVENTNLKGMLDLRGGGFGKFSGGAIGGLVIYYDDIAYGLVDFIEKLDKHVIYIPDNTENTTEAFIAAAQKRINDYLENDKIKIKYAGKIADLDEEIYKDVIDVSKTNGEYYTLTYGKLEMKFFIQKDSSKIKEVKEEHKTSDIATNITISTESKDVPLDTTIKVEEIKKEDKKFTEITKKLEVKEAIVYDLKLYSSSKNNYVSKLDNGSFKVTIPVPEALKNIKKLSAYYIQDDGTIEEYPADPDEIKKGNVVFNTKHFSIYTIAESGKGSTKVTEKNPDTFDGIANSIVVCFISLIGLCSALVISKKKDLN